MSPCSKSAARSTHCAKNSAPCARRRTICRGAANPRASRAPRLAKAASRLGLASVEELLARQPSDPALALARELIGARRDGERRLAEADDALTAAERELRDLEQARAKRGPCPDPAPLLQRLHAFSDIPADAERLRRETLAVSLERGRLAEEAARLDPSAGDIDALARLALPDAEDVEAARQTFDALIEDEKRASAEARALQARLAAVEDEIAALSRAGAALTREDLGAARAKRAEAHSRLGAALDGGPRQDARLSRRWATPNARWTPSPICWFRSRTLRPHRGGARAQGLGTARV